MTVPQVFITPDLDLRLASRLKDIVKRHNVRSQLICITYFFWNCFLYVYLILKLLILRMKEVKKIFKFHFVKSSCTNVLPKMLKLMLNSYIPVFTLLKWLECHSLLVHLIVVLAYNVVLSSDCLNCP